MPASVINVKHGMPFDVYIGRNKRYGDNKWGNPFTVERYGREVAIEKYKRWFPTSHLADQIDELIGKTLGCHCKPNSCHGDFLVEMAEKRRIQLAGKNYPPKRFIVCGPRKWPEEMYLYVFLAVAGLKKRFGDDIVIISGKASGVDTLAEWAAEDLDLEFEGYPADWKKYPTAAGPIRNKQMIDEGHPDWVVAIGYGRGTANMCAQARDAHILVTWRHITVKRFQT